MTVSWEEHAGEDSGTGKQDPNQRFKLYRLCDCIKCRGTGKNPKKTGGLKCPECRGEGKTRDLVATCKEDDVGATLITLGREGEWKDCAFGLLDTMGEVNEKWLIKPWLPSARNISEAGRQLNRARFGKAK